MAVTKLFIIYSKKDEVLDEEVEWRDSVGRQQRCATCRRPRQDLYPHPLTAEVMNRQLATVSLSGMSGLRIYKRAFFDLLQARIGDWVVPGPVTRVGGRIQPESVTMHFDPQREVPLRGGHGTIYRRCPTCSHVDLEIPWKVKPWNVLRQDLPDDGGIYYVAMRSFLLLSEEAIGEMRLKEDFPDLTYQRVLALDEPIEPVPELGDPVG